MNFYSSLIVLICGAGIVVPAFQAYGQESICPSGEFLCEDIKRCIETEEVCDQISQCPDGSDERNCPCTDYEFPCKESTCIHRDWLCDGVRDCPSGDDEDSNMCENQCNRGFKCKKREQCISANKVCDGNPDCEDFSDEHSCFKIDSGYLSTNYKGVSGFYICSDLWPTTYSDEICQKYWKNSKARTIYESAGEKDTLTLLDNFRSLEDSDKPSLKLLKSSHCKSSTIIKLRCAVNETKVERSCGYRREGPQEHGGLYLINGVKAMNGAYPWHAQIIVMDDYACGGSIIHKDWILTAAHCLTSVQKASDLQIVVGTNKRNDPWAIRMKVSRFVLHPSYETGQNDIALVKLEKPLRFSSRISPICLPNNMSLSQMMSYRYCVFSGFGNTNRASYQPANLMHARMNLMTGRECAKNLLAIGVRDRTMLRRYQRDKSILCAGSIPTFTGINVCKGDSGSPLVCRDNDGTWFQVGVTSHTISVNTVSCTSNIQMKVTHYLDFILKEMKKTWTAFTI